MSKLGYYKQLSNGQKTGFVLLLIFAITTVALGFLQMRNSIYGPFASRRVAKEVDLSFQFDEEIRLQQIDTDRDGINDYEELNFYQTSPYLPDTDSDGLQDKVEIDQGKDPLCAEGKICSQTSDTSPSSTPASLISPLVSGVGTVADVVMGSMGELNQGSTSSTVSGGSLDMSALTSNPEYVRQLLLQTGQISQEKLNSISDAELMSMVESIMQKQSMPTNTDGQTSSTPQM
ncbi:MAG: hypothetical protein WCW16_05220 [Candidatus Magasanikbacteria bacterium]